MQSGHGKTKEWLLESEPAPKILDPLMGTGCAIQQQIQLQFPTLAVAKTCAEKNGWPYTVELPSATSPKAYADNSPTPPVG